jgi:type I restriction enzyme R subunit
MPTPEEHARQHIDDLLVRAGWTIQDRQQLNLGEARGIAIRELPTANGPADYVLFVGVAKHVLSTRRQDLHEAHR